MRVSVVLGACALLNSPVLADALTPLSQAQQADFAAIGQISYGGPVGAAICTGTLVATDLVLTAGHCVAPDGDLMQAGRVQFAAGWRDGKSLAVRHGDEIILARIPNGQTTDLAQDMALIVLDHPIDARLVKPMALLDPALVADNYAVAGYRRDAPDILQGADVCPLLQTTASVLQLGCTVVSGNSGAPVMVQQDGIWRLAAVVVAASGDGAQARAYAVPPAPILMRLIKD